MERDEIKKQVVRIISESAGVDEVEITENSRLQDDLGVDSLDAVFIIMECEKEFNIGIPDDEAAELNTFGEIIDYIHKNVA